MEPDLLSAFIDHLEALLDPGTVQFARQISGDTWLHVTSGPDRDAEALVKAVDGGKGVRVNVVTPAGGRAGTVALRSADPAALRAAGDELAALLLPRGGNTTRLERTANSFEADELVLRGPVDLVRAAQADLLSTGAWALASEGQDGPLAYAALFRSEGPEGGPVEGPGRVDALAGCVAL